MLNKKILIMWNKKLVGSILNENTELTLSIWMLHCFVSTYPLLYLPQAGILKSITSQTPLTLLLVGVFWGSFKKSKPVLQSMT